MKQKVDWIIHMVAIGACGECGGAETSFLPYMCNAHTHGMECYGHLDFQMVLALPPQEIGRILNTLGLRVQSGECFRPGDMVSGIYEDCSVRLDEYEETGRRVLRVIIQRSSVWKGGCRHEDHIVPDHCGTGKRPFDIPGTAADKIEMRQQDPGRNL